MDIADMKVAEQRIQAQNAAKNTLTEITGEKDESDKILFQVFDYCIDGECIEYLFGRQSVGTTG
jgi:hypothetical protein